MPNDKIQLNLTTPLTVQPSFPPTPPGISLKEARIEVEKIIGRGSGFVAVEIPFTPRAKRVLELALEEARQLGHNYIGTEHLLLGLLREGEGVAARVLENLDADPSKIRSQVIRMVGESQEAVGAAPGAGGAAGGSKTPTLEEFGSDLTKQAEEAKLDPCIGRANEIIRVTQILGRLLAEIFILLLIAQAPANHNGDFDVEGLAILQQLCVQPSLGL